MEFVQHALEQYLILPVSSFLWNYVIIFLLIGSGIWFSWNLRFAQFTKIREMLRILGEGMGEKTQSGSMSSFQAFCISAASRVGVGNIAGIAIAIVLGGPGAVFWMWIIACLGSATSIVESTLGQIYKQPLADGSFHGGPAYYIRKGLNSRGFAIWFAILISITYGLIFNSVQANTIAASLDAWHLNVTEVGIGVAALTALVIFSGATRIAKITEFLVPIMAGLYILTALFIVVMNISHLPGMLANIVSAAWTAEAPVGGFLGAAMMNGFKRGLFSNEAGMGSIPNAAASSDVSHPIKQGLIQGLGVFVDTMFVCTSTAFIVLIIGDYSTTGLTGVQLVQHNLATELGSWAPSVMALFIFMFAFSSIVGNYFYGEVNICHLTQNRAWLHAFRVLVVGMVFVGAVSELPFVWNLADFFMAFMVLTNVAAILLLGKQVFIAYRDYMAQKASGIQDPIFKETTIGRKLSYWK